VDHVRHVDGMQALEHSGDAALVPGGEEPPDQQDGPPVLHHSSVSPGTVQGGGKMCRFHVKTSSKALAES
jgi:hypothetical protein